MQLPIFNERYVIERLVEAVSRFRLSRRAARRAGARRFHRRNSAKSRATCVERHRRAGPADHLYSPHQSRRLQSRRARKWTENFAAANSSRFSTRTSSPNPIFFAAPFPTFMNPATADRHGADALDLSQSRLFAAHPGRNDSARRPFCGRARRAFPPRHIFQFQRHRRSLASHRHRLSRRLGARHAHRRHRSLLSRATQRLEISLSAATSNAPPNCRWT